MYTTLEECYQCEGVAKAAQTGIVGFDRRFKLQRIYEANDCNLMSEKEGGLTIPNVAELIVTVFLSAVVGEACTHRHIGVQKREKYPNVIVERRVEMPATMKQHMIF